MKEAKKMLRLQKNEGLNIVPFIDIMLVLLAIILSVSTFIAHGQIKIELPKSESAEVTSQDKDKILIAINENSEFFIDDKASTLDDLRQKIQNIDEKTLVELKADKSSKFESFIEVIDILRTKDHKNFQILTERVQ